MKTKSKLEYELEYRLRIYEKLAAMENLSTEGLAILETLRQLQEVADGKYENAMDPFISADDDADWR